MVVATDPHVGDPLVTALRNRRVPVVSAETAASAVSLMSSTKIAAVILCLERATDWTDCEALIGAAGQQQVPVVALTRWTSLDGRFRRRAFDIGCAAFVGAPVDRDVVVAVVDRVTRGERHVDVVAN